MRAQTRGKHEIGKRLAILIGVAAVGVMALGAQTVMAQTAAEAPGVVEYPTKLTITTERCCMIHGSVLSGIPARAGSPAIPVRECEDGREVILFKKRPGPDRRLATTLSQFRPLSPSTPEYGAGGWGVPPGVGRGASASRAVVYAKVTPKAGDGFVCLGARSGKLSACVGDGVQKPWPLLPASVCKTLRRHGGVFPGAARVTTTRALLGVG